MELLLFLIILLTGNLVFGAKSKADQPEIGVVSLSPSSGMFYALYSARKSPENAPLIMWLQGGPGGSSYGVGNFLEVGPLDENLRERRDTWVNDVNVLFVDFPVGSGFSWTTKSSELAKNNDQIGAQGLRFLAHFFDTHPRLAVNPFWIFSESYGGKCSVAIAASLHQAIDSGVIKCNFRGIALGDPWIAPEQCQRSYADVLQAAALVTDSQAARLIAITDETLVSLSTARPTQAEDLFGLTQHYISNFTSSGPPRLHSTPKMSLPPLCTGTVNMYNLRLHVKAPNLSQLEDLMLSATIRAPLEAVLPASVTWGAQSDRVYNTLRPDFMVRPPSQIRCFGRFGLHLTCHGTGILSWPQTDCSSDVKRLLETTDLQVWIYVSWDLIVNSLCTERWVSSMGWSDYSRFAASAKVMHSDPASGQPEMFSKWANNLGIVWVLDAGHLVPRDQPAAARRMLRMIVGLDAPPQNLWKVTVPNYPATLADRRRLSPLSPAALNTTTGPIPSAPTVLTSLMAPLGPIDSLTFPTGRPEHVTRASLLGPPGGWEAREYRLDH
ncbi:putative Retinoid-inducible serine carboxypeptidase [Paratrimastix pyriformis]|uniref:Carboxypeptidase n=1 Tax=Paratrimastix pyriformis TaxID=342808 RepID=A0ABQ8ULZ8_9EUKA|nr:putative Retinoid-inducible serine carboxypeptidase [Paratrimastix pyriformis]